MGDFSQNGVITTLHNLRNMPIEKLEERLERFAEIRPMALVLPCLYSELEGEALPRIVSELKKVKYLNEIVIGLDRANEQEFKHAQEFFSELPQHHRIMWHDGPRLQALNQQLIEKNIAPHEMGKGRNAWFCFGYLTASGRAESIALHDCDIVTYDKSMLARLIYPVADPHLQYKFCKGYYFRTTEEKLSGRVCRLLVTPLLITLKKVLGHNQFLDYIDGFRYPLAGEFSMRADVSRTIRIPADWGLEIGILSEVHRNNAMNRICQVDIADRYDHKHQPLSEDNSTAGLSKMSIDIAIAIFRKLATEGTVFAKGTFRTIKSTYFRIATDMIEQYYADALINGLTLDRHTEEQTVDLFAQNIYYAGERFLENPMQTYYIPSWKRVQSAIPSYLDDLYHAVHLDNM